MTTKNLMQNIFLDVQNDKIILFIFHRRQRMHHFFFFFSFDLHVSAFQAMNHVLLHYMQSYRFQHMKEMSVVFFILISGL